MRTYLKTAWRDLRHSLGRFLAIVLIILMGVVLFVGIKSIGPQMKWQAFNYLSKTQTPQVSIIASKGLTESDREWLQNETEASVQLTYQLPYLEPDKQLNWQLYAYQPHHQTQLQLVSGKWPEATTDIVVDSQLATAYPLGSTVAIQVTGMKEARYTVVGYIHSPLYVDSHERGTTTLGDGKVAGIAYIPIEQFDLPAYNVAQLYWPLEWQLETTQTQLSATFSQRLSQLTTLLNERKLTRLDELKAQAQSTLDEQKTEVESQQQALSSAQSELQSAQTDLTERQQALDEQSTILTAQYGAEVATAQLQEPKTALDEAQQALTQQSDTLSEQANTIQEAETELTEAQQTIDTMATPTYIITKWQDYPGMLEYFGTAERIDTIANVFPVFFLFIAALITFTSMTRMLEEKRKEIGALKALGYHNGEIGSKYIMYALSAALIGSVLGVGLGTYALPQVVLSLLAARYTIPAEPAQIQWGVIVLSVGLAFMVTVGASLWVLRQQLQEKPAMLLIAKAPKAGKRVWLERLKFVWCRMSFRQKMTYRNLLRYRSRLWLTVGGIAGCMGLMLAGFGLQSSIPTPIDWQLARVSHYQAIVLRKEATTDWQQEDVVQQLAQVAAGSEVLPVQIETVKVTLPDNRTQEATVYVIDTDSDWTSFIGLQSVMGKDWYDPARWYNQVHHALVLTSNGVVAGQQWSAYIDQTLPVELADGTQTSWQLQAVSEQYVGQAIYMSRDYYEQVMGIKAKVTGYLVKTPLSPSDATTESELATAWLAQPEIATVNFLASQLAQKRQAAGSLDRVVYIFILLSGALALVVLYNLTVINIAERERELATIKVLGFYSSEVTMHIVRENIVFTVLGIALGCGVGQLLTRVILGVASSDMMVFPVILPLAGYALSAGLTICFTVAVSILTHIKLQRIEMVEALKSNE